MFGERESISRFSKFTIVACDRLQHSHMSPANNRTTTWVVFLMNSQLKGCMHFVLSPSFCRIFSAMHDVHWLALQCLCATGRVVLGLCERLCKLPLACTLVHAFVALRA